MYICTNINSNTHQIMLNTLNYRTEWIEMINTLPDGNDRNALLAAITMYQFNGQIPQLSPTLNLIFLFIKKEIDCVTLQLQAEAAKKDARRLKRLAKPSGNITEEPQSPSRKPAADTPTDPTIVKSTPEINTHKPHKPVTHVKPDKHVIHDEPDRPATFDTQSKNPDEPIPSSPQSEEPIESAVEKSVQPLSKSKAFNAILRAKERHDRNRKTSDKHHRN